MSFKHLFRSFLEATPERIHFAAHSHHPWPDATKAAHMAAWMDAAELADRKWEKVFGEILPRARAHVARILNLPDAGTLAFAPNTHEFVVRLLSCLPHDRPVRILTTDSEFHSFDRQVRRLEEEKLVTVVRVPSEPFSSFASRFVAEEAGSFDLIFLSQAFFNSGYIVSGPDLASVVNAVSTPETFIVIDGYHSFCATPVDLARIAGRAFFLAGGYKYAMAGEGACFLHAPPGYGPRPLDTGWFASFGTLHNANADTVGYASDGGRFFGATFDPSGLYRFVSAMDLLQREGIDVAAASAHVDRIQRAFLTLLETTGPSVLKRARLVVRESGQRGRFLTFESEHAKDAYERLLQANILTDVRGNRLRFGFGLYHDESDLPGAMKRISEALSDL